MEQMLRCAIPGDDTKCSDLLAVLELTHNLSIHATTRTAPFEPVNGFTPAKPLCRRLGLSACASPPLLPPKANAQLQLAKRKLRRAQEYQKHYAGMKRGPMAYVRRKP